MGETNSAERLTLRDEPSAAAQLRAAVDRLADARSLSAAVRFDLKVAATEALANAFRGASPDAPVDVSVHDHDDVVEIEVHDTGTFRLEHRADSEGGRGIPLMVALVDEVEFSATDAGTRVRMRRRGASRQQAPSRRRARAGRD